MNKNNYKYKAENDDIGKRIDIFVSANMEKNRNYIKKLVEGSCVMVNGKVVKSSYRLKELDEVIVQIPEAKEIGLEAVSMDLDIIHEDSSIIVINKAAGMVVHPGQGDSHSRDSLVNALLAHCKDLGKINDVIRPGIVHRLDKDTSGVLIVAKNEEAMNSLTNQFKDRTVKKKYLALVVGHIHPAEATIDSPIGRDTRYRKKMAIRDERNGRNAVTKYIVQEYYDGFSLLNVYIETGRTHQIRVHLQAIGFPVVGDDVYGKKKVNKEVEQLSGLKRQFLHASEIEIVHPEIGKRVKYTAELPDDLKAVLKAI